MRWENGMNAEVGEIALKALYSLKLDLNTTFCTECNVNSRWRVPRHIFEINQHPRYTTMKRISQRMTIQLDTKSLDETFRRLTLHPRQLHCRQSHPFHQFSKLFRTRV